jgi:hypothetical protein
VFESRKRHQCTFPNRLRTLNFCGFRAILLATGISFCSRLCPQISLNWGAQLGAQRQEKAGCPQMPVKAAEIRGFQPIDTLYRKSDDKGLYLEIRPNGSKHWFLKYRIHGSEKRLSLGTWPEVSLAYARERRDDARQKDQGGR